jgi:hypothetical protein
MKNTFFEFIFLEIFVGQVSFSLLESFSVLVFVLKQEVKRERERKKKSQHIAHINRKRVINSKHMFFTFYFNHPFIGTFQPHTFRV